jgi:anti-sigma-K factor RskA
MTEQTLQRGFEVAIENLTTELRSHRDETREDFKELRADVKDIKSDVSDVKQRLVAIETQNTTTAEARERNWGHFSGWAALVIAAITAAVMWFKGG